MKKLALIFILLAGLIVPLACTNSQPTGPLATYNLTATYTYTFTSTPTNWAGYTSTPTPGPGTNTATPFSPPAINNTPTPTFVITSNPSQPTPALNGLTVTTGSPANGVAFDGSTTIYVAEGTEGSTGGSIQMFNTSGTSLGTMTTNGSAVFGQPNGVAYYGGNIYVVDQVNMAVYEINPIGPTLINFTSPNSFLSPEGIAVNSTNGDVYVADTGNDRIVEFSSSLAYLATFGSTGSGNSQFNNPSAVAVDGSGNIYVADASNQRVQIFNSSNTYTGQFWTAVSAESDVYGITLDTNIPLNIYLADSGTDQIEEYTSTGTFITSGLGNPATANPDPVGLVFLGTNTNLLVADYVNSQIYSVTP
jgi:hypothetical protein